MSARLPLAHLRATVLTQAWAGAYATRLLADMGAEVIQIEALNRIDPWRRGNRSDRMAPHDNHPYSI